MEKFYHWKVAWVLGNVRMASMPFARSLDRDRIFSRELFPGKQNQERNEIGRRGIINELVVCNNVAPLRRLKLDLKSNERKIYVEHLSSLVRDHNQPKTTELESIHLGTRNGMLTSRMMFVHYLELVHHP